MRYVFMRTCSESRRGGRAMCAQTLRMLHWRCLDFRRHGGTRAALMHDRAPGSPRVRRHRCGMGTTMLDGACRHRSLSVEQPTLANKAPTLRSSSQHSLTRGPIQTVLIQTVAKPDGQHGPESSDGWGCLVCQSVSLSCGCVALGLFLRGNTF